MLPAELTRNLPSMLKPDYGHSRKQVAFEVAIGVSGETGTEESALKISRRQERPPERLPGRTTT